ncbi:hypothetical protein [Streptomyces sp. NBC_01235]|uniref:hypothetical protein n=1 Tax=Streptomyces sp. NBC_01235 TaxID=2903788 RepID=UPI002E0FC494|nr:hypothetical protein OG289_21035 [Streptomyces sp. NBC_01235]
MTQRHSALAWRRGIIATVAMGAAFAGLLGFLSAWDGEPYPVADPAATATRLDGLTQTVYEALALPGAALDPDWRGTLKAEEYGCHYRGLSHWEEQLSDSPPSVPGVVNVSAEWTLTGVSEERATAAMRRARTELTRQGWQGTDHENAAGRLITLQLEPADTYETPVPVSVWVTALPGDRLEVSAYAECARYPEGTPLDAVDRPSLPHQLAPAPLRD